MTDSMDDLNELLDDLKIHDQEMDDLITQYDFQVLHFENWMSVHDELIKQVNILNATFEAIFESYENYHVRVINPVILRLYYSGLVSAYEGFVRGVFCSMVEHKDVCDKLLLMINSIDYKHHESLMNLSGFKGRKNKDELLDSFYKSSFSNASKLAVTLYKLFGLKVFVPDELHQIIERRNLFVHNSGLRRDGTELIITGDDLAECGSILQLAASNYINAINLKINESQSDT